MRLPDPAQRPQLLARLLLRPSKVTPPEKRKKSNTILIQTARNFRYLRFSLDRPARALVGCFVLAVNIGRARCTQTFVLAANHGTAICTEIRVS
eukprot:824878-Rhodomonas_salina.1